MGQGISTSNNGLKKDTAAEGEKPAAKGADEKPAQKVAEAPKPARQTRLKAQNCLKLKS